MALSAAEWETRVNAMPNGDELRKLIMWTDARGAKKFPDRETGWRRDAGWRALIRILMESEYNTENMDFLEDVDAFYSGQPGVGRVGPPARQDLYDDYVKDHAPKLVNIPATIREPLASALLDGDDSTLKLALDAADHEVTKLVTEDPYWRLRAELREKVQPAWAKAQDAGKTEVGAVMNVVREAHEDPPDPEDVDEWNGKALKALSRNAPTDFFHSGEVVIVANPAAGVPPPGIGWLNKQSGIVNGTVTKRGGVFGAATILAKGVRNRANFEDALRAAVPDIQIEYPESTNEPKQKVSAFGRK